jgi:hypothetical protein
MAEIYEFKSQDEKGLEAFFSSMAADMEWAIDMVFIAHDKAGNIRVGVLSKEPERMEDTYVMGILDKAKISTFLGEED